MLTASKSLSGMLVKCVKCGEMKESEEFNLFYKKKTGVCEECKTKYQTNWLDVHKEKYQENKKSILRLMAESSRKFRKPGED